MTAQALAELLNRWLLEYGFPSRQEEAGPDGSSGHNSVLRQPD